MKRLCITFLQTHFSRKLHHYNIYYPLLDGEAYLPVSQGFVDRLTQDMAQGFRINAFVMESRYRWTSVDARKNRMPGVVYLTELKIVKPDNDFNQSELTDVGYW